MYIGKQRRDKRMEREGGRRELTWFLAASLFLTLNHSCAWLFSLIIVFKICIISLRGEGQFDWFFAGWIQKRSWPSTEIHGNLLQSSA